MALPALAMLVAAGELFVASATSETRAGQSPVTPNEAPRAFAAEVLIPSVGVQLGRPNDMLAAYYAPRILFQEPNAAHQLAPLVMHAGRLLLSMPFSRRAQLLLTADASYGHPDYTTLVQSVPAGQATLPQLTTLFTASAQASLRVAVTRRLDLSFAASLFHFQQPSTSMMPVSPNGLPAITQQTSVGFQPTLFYRVSRVSQLVVDTSALLASYFANVQLLTVHATAGVRQQLTRAHVLTLTLGAAYARDVGSQHVLLSNLSPVSPAGEVRLDSRLTRQGTTALSSRVGARVDYIVDPLLETAVPGARVFGRLVMVLDPDWTFSPEGDFGTSIRRTPYMGDPDETVFSVLLPARRRLSPHLAMELGVRWSDRGQTLASPAFHFHQREVFAYFLITGTTVATRRAISVPP